MKTYKFDFKRALDEHPPQGRAEIVALWHAVVVEDGDFAPYHRTRTRGVLEIRRHGAPDRFVLATDAARDCFVTLLSERYCGPGEQLSDLEEDLYWAGSHRRAREDT